MTSLNYSLSKPGGFLDNLALNKRKKMFDLFMDAFADCRWRSALDVGVTADINALASNYFEKYYPCKENIIALSNQDASFLEEVYPGLTFKQGDARHLPFDDKSVDVVFSSAVIEHVGSLENQKKMLAECVRVAKVGVFITTPNRWYPIELHTILPFIHWLPKRIHRKILRTIGLTFYAEEGNLNLLDRHTLSRFCQELGVSHFMIKSIKTAGMPSNLVLIIKK